METKRSFSYLMMALNEIEEHLELQANSQNEKLILASIILIAEEHNGSAYIDYIKTHQLTAKIPLPSLYRGLNVLIEQKKIYHIGRERSGVYALSDDEITI